MSPFVIRPADPVPATWLKSTLLSFAIFLTSGDDRTFSPEAAAAAGSATAATGAAAEAGAAFAGAGPTGFPAPLPPTTATTVFPPTVAPSGNLISVSTPAAGDGISASTLSVEISNRGSSRSTRSPTCFSHFVIVPSVIDSPICGIGTSVPVPPPAAGALAAGAAGASIVAGAATRAAAATLAPAPSPITATTVL